MKWMSTKSKKKRREVRKRKGLSSDPEGRKGEKSESRKRNYCGPDNSLRRPGKGGGGEKGVEAAAWKTSDVHPKKKISRHARGKKEGASHTIKPPSNLQRGKEKVRGKGN